MLELSCDLPYPPKSLGYKNCRQQTGSEIPTGCQVSPSHTLSKRAHQLYNSILLTASGNNQNKPLVLDFQIYFTQSQQHQGGHEVPSRLNLIYFVLHFCPLCPAKLICAGCCMHLSWAQLKLPNFITHHYHCTVANSSLHQHFPALMGLSVSATASWQGGDVLG